MSEKYKVIERLEKRSVVVGRVCDICGKPIPSAQWHELKPFYKITTGHFDWGNDSCDSVETKDACSPVCATKLAIKYLNDTYGKRNSAYIEIEHINSWVMPVEEVEE